MESDNLGIPSNESNYEHILNEINLSVMQLRPQSPTNTSSCFSDDNLDSDDTTFNLLASVQPPKRSPHCSTCQHTKTGHGIRSSTTPYAKCTMCPNNICSPAGRHKPCTCLWHIYEQNSIHPELFPYSIVRSTTINHVNEYLLSFCQSNIGNQLLGSNACTIIAVLVSINFLSGTAWFSQHTIVSTLDSTFLGYCHQLFIEGNQLYESLEEEQVNYCAPEIIQHPQLGFKDIAERGDEYHFDNFADFLLQLQLLSSSKVKIALVLIFNPDKAMTLLINELGQSMLVERHSHLDTGAIIATTNFIT
ncbi:uncharacterized protein LOC114518637 [Dendronephthya gigantea]|uniref:uncharacterized protein LOC114518637 n=1 Tax=Dendronephthya gigantea TaxID=151771 RepID=UPI00106A6415|nr:uncharacterized protein LOC114518637 [Dendronephthya gigantea]